MNMNQTFVTDRPVRSGNGISAPNGHRFVSPTSGTADS
ncbi:hypothetical protein DFO58_3196 [Arthrobacter sp. AG1021]|nr:hypothetical protein DFO58_3196 [Arthrobacter sp. AG1021]